MSAPGNFEDLATRSGSGLVIAALGIGAIWLGGLALDLLACVASGVMTWELARFGAAARRNEALVLGLLAAGLLAVALVMHRPHALGLLAVVPLVGALLPRRDRLFFAGYGLALALAAYGLTAFRGGYGLAFVLWLVAVVVASDIMGYFGGRLIGGPKFWPRISPKKTWSGTVAGWVGAALVGAATVAIAGASLWLVPFSALVAFAAQMGDIAESALKRRAEVKDSSHIIPGHGGVLDRFDAMIGAIVFILVWGMFLPVPAIGG